jgi:hypothetical protein
MSSSIAGLHKVTVLRALWQAAAPSKSDTKWFAEVFDDKAAMVAVQQETIVEFCSRPLNIRFTSSDCIDLTGYDACHGEGKGEEVLKKARQSNGLMLGLRRA